MTDDEAAKIVRQLQLILQTKTYKRAGPHRYRQQLFALRKAGADNEKMVLWLQNQKPKVLITRTKLRAYFKREDRKEAEHGQA